MSIWKTLFGSKFVSTSSSYWGIPSGDHLSQTIAHFMHKKLSTRLFRKDLKKSFSSYMFAYHPIKKILEKIVGYFSILLFGLQIWLENDFVQFYVFRRFLNFVRLSEFLVKDRNSIQKSKFSSKIKFFVKNQNFCQKSKFFFKNRNSCQK